MKKIVVKIGADSIEDLDNLRTPKQIRAFPDHVFYFKSIGQFTKILSARKLGLLKYLSDATGENVTKVSIQLGRKKEAVSRDLHQLEALGFLKLKKRGKNVYPQANYRAIQIEF